MLAEIGPVEVVGILVWIFLFGLISSGIWKSKGGNPASGFLIGAVLGLLGLIYVAAAKPSQAQGSLRCPFCAEEVRADAIVCKHCHRDLPRVPCPNCKTQMQAATGAICPNCGLKPDLMKTDGVWWTRDKQKRNFQLDEASGEWK